ncbi:hypothetical protein TIFTF001_028956 [Ficus carica]|uniref:Uncharacterized protein n=1 Tax=Ficus carica TaxID=3494 RepID=A0AA88DU57_FICCA|nr:hypothetical protein TIFTF001_028956 [Ficus carica]
MKATSFGDREPEALQGTESDELRIPNARGSSRTYFRYLNLKY